MRWEDQRKYNIVFLATDVIGVHFNPVLNKTNGFWGKHDGYLVHTPPITFGTDRLPPIVVPYPSQDGQELPNSTWIQEANQKKSNVKDLDVDIPLKLLGLPVASNRHQRFKYVLTQIVYLHYKLKLRLIGLEIAEQRFSDSSAAEMDGQARHVLD